MDMQIDQLIRDLILEDQFKEKYTKRQRSIFCKNMYGKISSFIQSHQEELKETQNKLHKSRKAYDSLYKTTVSYLWVSVVYTFITFIAIVCFVYVVIFCP